MRWYMRHERLITVAATVGTLGGWAVLMALFPSPWTVLACVVYALILAQSIRRWQRHLSSRTR